MDSDDVRKRKEYAERKVKERHAALRKEADERRKQAVEHRERVQSVLKREQVLLQKRMQQLNEDEERKKVTLAKQHEATSRTAAINKSPKSFAFGSSTPRTLAYLDNLPKSEQQYDKKLRPLEDSSQVTSPTSTASTTKFGRGGMTTPQRPPPAAHRPAPTMTSMTSSMYVTSSAPPTRHAKTIAKPLTTTTTTTTTKRLSHGPSMMTQSVYTPTSRPATTTRLSMGTTRGNRGMTPTSSRPTTSVASTPNTRRSLDIRKPPMPRKSVLGKPEPRKQPSPVPADVPVVQEPISEEPVVQEVVVPVVEAAPEAPEVTEEVTETTTEVVENLVEVEEIIEAPQTVVTPSEATPVNEESVHALEVVDVMTPFEVTPSVDNLIDLPAEQIPEVTPAVENVTETPVQEQEQEHKQHELISLDEPAHVNPTAPEAIPAPTSSEILSEVSSEEHPREDLLHEETGSSANTSLADELINIGNEEHNDSMEMPSKPEVVELEYPMPNEPPKGAANDLVDVFGNDYINENRAQRIVEFDEDTDSGKASPTSSETSSTTDEVTPRSVIEEVKIAAPRVLPIVRSAEDMARKEKEAREAEERKNRLAAILAKSRGMASPMTNTLPPTAADIKDSTAVTTSPPTPPSPLLPVEQPTSSSTANANADNDNAEKANESGKANDVLARVAAMTNSSTLQKILQRKQGSNPSLQTSESTGGEIY